jgi:hypothetical protein
MLGRRLRNKLRLMLRLRLRLRLRLKLRLRLRLRPRVRLRLRLRLRRQCIGLDLGSWKGLEVLHSLELRLVSAEGRRRVEVSEDVVAALVRVHVFDILCELRRCELRIRVSLEKKGQ